VRKRICVELEDDRALEAHSEKDAYFRLVDLTVDVDRDRVALIHVANAARLHLVLSLDNGTLLTAYYKPPPASKHDL